ncbi:MAG: YfhL family 4Fe-4S dicluster ferredoxin [Chloroflexi bacterium]|nr:YfhL family 4Fe-4S dicluster ferredoxin [Chloroflexota bacterium]
MAMKIIDSCINCGACEPECPNEAISEGDDIYVVASERCTECIGAFDTAKCIDVCPVDGCIVLDPERKESRDALLDRYKRLHGQP